MLNTELLYDAAIPLTGVYLGRSIGSSIEQKVTVCDLHIRVTEKVGSRKGSMHFGTRSMKESPVVKGSGRVGHLTRDIKTLL